MPDVSAAPDGEMLAGPKRRLRLVAGQRDGDHRMRARLYRHLVVSRDRCGEEHVATGLARSAGVDHQSACSAWVLPGGVAARDRIESDQSPEPESLHCDPPHRSRDRPQRTPAPSGTAGSGLGTLRCRLVILIRAGPYDRESPWRRPGEQECCLLQYLSMTRLAILRAASRPGLGCGGGAGVAPLALAGRAARMSRLAAAASGHGEVGPR
jgi:hypothetical protein